MGPTLMRVGQSGAALLLVLVALIPTPSKGSAFGIPEFLEFGECAETKNMADLDINRYSGVWFAQEMVPNEYSQIVSCSMTNYTWRTESIMKVVEKGITAQNRKVRQNSVLRQDPDREEGNFVVEADGVPSAPFQIVDTDYDNYACVHSCMAFMGFRAAFSWIYTRKPDADHSYVVHCRDTFTKMSIDPTPLQPMKQGKGCPYMDKIHHILSYSETVQTKAKMAASTARPKTTSTTTTTAATTSTTAVPTTTTRRMSTTASPSEETLHEVEITLIENDLENAQELEKRLLEEEEQMHKELEAVRRRQEEERRREEEEIRRMEEERQREEEERRRMEEERMRMEEERRLMEEERKRMEEERALMEEETRREQAETRAEAEELEELRHDVRAEIRRNHRGSKHRTEYSQNAESSTSGLSTSAASILLTMLLSTIFRH